MSIKILYVEDEPFLGKIVKESLESRGFEVDMQTDGAKVLAAFERTQPDICVLDVMLPNKDGFTIGSEIRAINPRIPIIFLTAKNQTEDLLKGFESGGNDYVKKPFSMEELIARIDNLLILVRTQDHIPKSASQEVITVGKYKFFPQKYELHFEEEVRQLSHREATLFQILINHQNQSVERKFILTEVWGDDSIFNSRNLDVYITKLRGYLKKDEHIKILTLKGVGYHFIVE